MKTQIITLFVVLFVLNSCNNQTKENTASLVNNDSKIYNGPIIDMHIHAYSSVNPMFGLENKNP